MSLRERFVRRFAGTMLTEVAQEAAAQALREAAVGVDPDEHLWRSMNEKRRDFPAFTHTRAQDISFSLYQQNALGHRLTELGPDFIVGDGITFSCTNQEVREVVDEFWNDDVNNLELRQHDFALELGLYGELLPEALIGEVSGVVQLGYIDSGQVLRIETLTSNPLVHDQVVVKVRGEERSIPIIRDRGDGTLQGEVFFFHVNSVSNSTRGWPDLLHVADWIDAYDQMLWEMVERARLARSFIWDVLVKGTDQKGAEEWARRYASKPPRSGSVRVHNEQVEWSAVAPTLGSFEASEEADVQLAHIAASAGYPKHWLSSSADVNRATAQEMGAPTVRKLGRRQAYFVACLRRILRLVVEKSVASGRIAADKGGRVVALDDEGQPVTIDGEELKVPAWQTVRLHAPEISPRDTFRAGQLMTQLAAGLAAAEANDWFGKDTSRRAMAAALAQMGVDFKPSEESDPEVKEPADQEPQPVQPASSVTALPTGRRSST